MRIGRGLPVHVVLGDLNRDGHTEIIATEGVNLHVFRDDGSVYPGWPLQGGSANVLGIPVIVDVDGDGLAEIAVTMGNQVVDDSGQPRCEPKLNAYRANGQVSRSWRLLGANGNQPASPAIGDFDGDGQTELAINYRVISGGGTTGDLREGVLTVLRLGVPYRPNPGDWSTAFHDVRNSSRGFTPARLQFAQSASGLKLSWPSQPESPLVQFTASFDGPDWNWLTGFVALDQGRYTATLDATNACRFYRLQYR